MLPSKRLLESRAGRVIMSPGCVCLSSGAHGRKGFGFFEGDPDRIVGARIYGAILSKSATCERTRPGPAAEDRYSRRGW